MYIVLKANCEEDKGIWFYFFKLLVPFTYKYIFFLLCNVQSEKNQHVFLSLSSAKLPPKMTTV